MSILSIDDTMPIGKHQGELVSHVLSTDLAYCVWFADEVEDYEFDDEILVALESDCTDLAVRELLGLE